MHLHPPSECGVTGVHYHTWFEPGLPAGLAAWPSCVSKRALSTWPCTSVLLSHLPSASQSHRITSLLLTAGGRHTRPEVDVPSVETLGLGLTRTISTRPDTWKLCKPLERLVSLRPGQPPFSEVKSTLWICNSLETNCHAAGKLAKTGSD